MRRKGRIFLLVAVIADGRVPHRTTNAEGLFSMVILGYFLLAAARVMDVVLLFFMWVVIFRAVLSWVNPDPYNAIVRFVNKVTEPVLYPIRSRLPMSYGGIDFSPIIVFLAIIFLRTFVVNRLFRMADSLI